MHKPLTIKSWQLILPFALLGQSVAQWLSCSTGRSTVVEAASLRPTSESAQPPPIVVTVHQPRDFGDRPRQPESWSWMVERV